MNKSNGYLLVAAVYILTFIGSGVCRWESVFTGCVYVLWIFAAFVVFMAFLDTYTGKHAGYWLSFIGTIFVVLIFCTHPIVVKIWHP